MSNNAHRLRRSDAKLCQGCKARPAPFNTRANRRMRWRRDHTLCRRCHQSVRDAAYVGRLHPILAC